MVGESARIAFVGVKHLVDGVSRGGRILQAVRGVVPATAHVKMLTAFGGMVHDYGVFRVAAVLYEGVPPAALLPHVIEDEVSRSVVCVA